MSLFYDHEKKMLDVNIKTIDEFFLAILSKNNKKKFS